MMHATKGKPSRRLISLSSILLAGSIIAVAVQQHVAIAGGQLQMSPKNTWTLIPGVGAHDVAVGSDGTVYVVSRERNVSKGAFYVYKRAEKANEWTRMGDDVAAMRVAVQGTTPWIVDGGGNLKKHGGGAWTTVRSPRAKDIGANARGVWLAGYDRNTYTLKGRSWQKVKVVSDRIDVDANGDPWRVDHRGQIFARKGNEWKARSDSIAAADISVDAPGPAKIVGTDGNVYIYKYGKWTALSENSSAIAVGVGAGQIWAVSRDGAVYKMK